MDIRIEQLITRLREAVDDGIKQSTTRIDHMRWSVVDQRITDLVSCLRDRSSKVEL